MCYALLFDLSPTISALIFDAVGPTSHQISPDLTSHAPLSLTSLAAQDDTPALTAEVRFTMLKMLTEIHSTDLEMKIYVWFCTGWATKAGYMRCVIIK